MIVLIFFALVHTEIKLNTQPVVYSCAQQICEIQGK